MASELKATNRPSPEIDGRVAGAVALGAAGADADPFGGAGWRSKTKMSTALFVSPGTRLVAALAKATVRPSADSAGGGAGGVAGLPPLGLDPDRRPGLEVADEDVGYVVGVARHEVVALRHEGDDGAVAR